MKPAVVLCIVFVALFVDALHAMPSQTVPTAKPVNGKYLKRLSNNIHNDLSESRININ